MIQMWLKSDSQATIINVIQFNLYVENIKKYIILFLDYYQDNQKQQAESSIQLMKPYLTEFIISQVYIFPLFHQLLIIQNNTVIIGYDWMQKLPLPKCINGHDASLLCTEKSCTKSSPICHQQHCEYYKNHQQCISVSNVQAILRFIQKKQLMIAQVHQEIINSFDNLQKILEIQKQNYIKQVDQLESILTKKQIILQRLLREGPSSEITPKLVSEVILDLSQNSKTYSYIQKLKENVINNTRHLAETIQEILTKNMQSTIVNFRDVIKSQIKSQSQLTQFIFKKQFCKQNMQIKNNGAILKASSGFFSNFKNFQFGLINPAVSKKSRIVIRILKDGGSMRLGLANLKQVQKNGFQRTKEDKGVYMVTGHEGFVCNVCNSSENWEYSLFNFRTGDVIVMQYNSQSEQLKLQNKTQNLDDKLSKIGINQNNPLHFCVYFWDKGDSVEILESFL